MVNSFQVGEITAQYPKQAVTQQIETLSSSVGNRKFEIPLPNQMTEIGYELRERVE